MSHLKKITKIVVNVLTCLLLFILVLVIYGKIATTFGKNSYPNYFGYTFFEVASGSMEPALHINDVVFVKITKEDFKEKDIIAFVSDDTVITHRVMIINGDVITVKGDHNDVVDMPITHEQVIGRIVKVFPELGIWKKVLTDPKILFAIFITMLLFDFALSYGEKDKKIEELLDLDEGKEIVKPITNEKKEEKVEKEKEKEEVKEEKKEKVIESEKLLELTRKIDIDEINKLLEGTEYRLEKKESNNIKKEITRIEESKEKDEEVVPKFNENERKVLEYTLRLDLNGIQKKISDKVK